MRNFIADGVAVRYPALRGDQYLVVKEPNGSAGAPIIMEAVPESRLIFLVRDSRDTVASRLDANKKGNWGVQKGVEINWEYDTMGEIVLDAYDRLIGLQLCDVAVDGCITKAPCGGEKRAKARLTGKTRHQTLHGRGC